MAWNSFELKLIAILTMLSDHVGRMFFPQALAFQLLGRMTFPLFAWAIANGYRHTRDVNKYLSRLFVFALLAQLPFMLALRESSPNPLHYVTEWNALCTLFLGLAGLVCYARVANKGVGLSLVLLVALVAHGLRTDYGAVGVLSVFGFHVFRRQYGARVVSQLGLFFFLYLRLFPQHDAVTLLVSIASTACTITTRTPG